MGHIDIYTSRRTFHIKCEWYKAKKDNQKLIYDTPKEIFYAKLANSINQSNDMVGGFLQIKHEAVTLMTPDNVEGMKPNDKVRFYNEDYRVISIQKRMIKKNSEFMKKPSYYTYIEVEA